MRAARAWLLLLIASAVLAQEPELPRVSAVRASGEMRVDGRLDEPFWREVPEQGGFRRLGRAEAPSVATTFRLATDGEALRLGIICAEPDPGPLAVNTPERDGPIWTDDSVEVLVQPGPAVYYQFAVNAGGAVYDARTPVGGEAGRAAAVLWDGVWQAATARDGGAWTVELRVPLAALDLGPDTWPAWRLNVGRTAARRMEYSAWAPVAKGFHDLPRFGWLNGLALDPDDWPLDGSGLTVGPLFVGDNRVRLSLPARRAGRFRVAASVRPWTREPPPEPPAGQPVATRRGALPLDLKVPVRQPGTLHELLLAITDEATGRLVLLRTQLFRAPQPFQVELAWPVFYHGDRQASAHITLALAPGSPPTSLSARLLREGTPAGRPVAMRLARPGEYAVTLPLAGLPDGVYQAEFAAQAPGVGEWRTRSSFALVRGPWEGR